ncbi:MAG: DUF6600 domain-containing protein [Pyrinomonadaceae bacterium]
MRYKTLALSVLSLLLTLTTFHTVARAADDNDDTYQDDDNGYEETARVVRVSLVAGDVSLRRAGTDKWEAVAPNLPLVEGDRLTTGANSRLEIQIDARNFLRVGESATLDIVTLRDAGVALSLPAGTATLRLARFDHAHEYFEIDAPGTTVAAEQAGLYRLDVDAGGKVRVAVREGGRARLYSASSGFTLRDGRVAESVASSDAKELDWEFSDVRPFDNFDVWVDARERDLLARLRYDDRERYYDPQVYGAEELDAYGDWVETHDYGYVWRPRATVINTYNDWAPYRYGRWDWCPPYGWVWVGEEPWGWAPYHYGRWVYYDNNWCWAPRGYYGYQHRSWWRPALVAFVNVNLSFGNDICWYPLPYHHSDPHSNFWRRALRPERISERRRNELAELRHVGPIYRRAVSGLPTRDFTRGGARPRHVDDDTARIALATDPLRGRFPLRPSGGEGGGATQRDRSGDGRRADIPSRRGDAAGGDTARAFPERRTGAGARRPGVPLDEELRRQRIFNNREPAFNRGARHDGGGGTPTNSAGGDPARRENPGNERGTGAVSRPTRLPDADGANGRRGTEAGGGIDDPRRTRRTERPANPENERPGGDGGTQTPERRANPVGHERRGGDNTNDNTSDNTGDNNGGNGGDNNGTDRSLTPRERPARPDTRDSRPATTERERGRREDRPATTVESRDPTPERHEPQPERRESQPEQHESQPERHESQPERRAEPSPRSERPEPRREERPREERHEPARQERPSPPPREERPSPAREERPAPREERPAAREEKSSPKSEERRSEPSRDTPHPSREKPPSSE